MTHSHPSSPDQLFTYAGHLANGTAAEPSTELETLLAELQEALVPDMPRQTHSAIKEQIMSTATLQPTTIPRTAMPTPIRRIQQPRPLYIAAAILLVLSIVGSAFLINQQHLNVDDVPPAPAVIASPEATASPTAEQTTCIGEDSVPIFQHVEESPVDAASLYTTTGGELRLHCPSVTEDEVLATGVDAVYAMNTPGIIIVVQREPDRLVRYLNLTSRKSFPSRQLTPPGAAFYFTSDSGSRWMVVPDSNEELALVDMRTMRATQLSETGDVDLRAVSGTDITISADGRRSMVRLRVNTTLQPFTSQQQYLNAVVIIDADGQPTFVSAPNDVNMITHAVLSPDGQHIAILNQLPDRDIQSYSTEVIIIDADTGEEIVRSDPVDAGGPIQPIWTADANEVLYGGQTRVYALAPEAGNEPRVVFDTAASVGVIVPTRDPTMFVIEPFPQFVEDGDDAAVPVINLEGELVHELQGSPIGQNRFEPSIANVIITADSSLELDQPATYHVHDPLTGELIGTIEDAPGNQSSLFREAQASMFGVALSQGREIWAIAMGQHNIWLTADASGAPVLRHIAPPADLGREDLAIVQITISGDGRWLGLVVRGEDPERRYMMDLTDQTPSWIPIDPVPQRTAQGLNFEYTSAASGSVQSAELATPGASPVVDDLVPAAYGCGIDRFIPTFTGVDTPPVPTTSLLLGDDGGLSLYCERTDSSTSVMSGVSRAEQTGYLPVLDITMADDKHVLLNLNTEAASPPLSGTSAEGLPPASSSPWFVVESPDDGRPSLLDTRTMTFTPLSDLPDANLMRGDIWFSTSASIDRSTSVVLITATESNGQSNTSQSEVFVVRDSVADASKLEIPAEMPFVDGVQVSPDGLKVLLFGSDRGTAQMSNHVAAYDLASGESIFHFQGENYTFGSIPLWSADSDAVYVTDGGTLLEFELSSPSEPTVLVDGDYRNASLYATHDAAVIIMGAASTDGRGGVVLLVNTETGKTTQLEGNWESPPPNQPMPVNLIVLDQSSGRPSTPYTTYVLVDPVTGKTLVTAEEAPIYIHPAAAALNAPMVNSAFTLDGNTTVFAAGADHMYVATTIDGSTTLRHVTPPEELESEEEVVVDMGITSDGRWLKLTHRAAESTGDWYLDLSDPDAEWINAE